MSDRCQSRALGTVSPKWSHTKVAGPSGPLAMTGQTVQRLIAVSSGGCNPGLSCDLAPLCRWCLLLWLGFLLPEGYPNYPSVIDQVPRMIQQKKLNLYSRFVVFHRLSRFGIFFPLHCLFSNHPASPMFMRVPQFLPFRTLFPAQVISRVKQVLQPNQNRVSPTMNGRMAQANDQDYGQDW